MARLKSPKCEHCQQTIRAKREPKDKPLPAVVNEAWLLSGSSPGERWGRHLASFHPGGIEAWEHARAIGHKVLMEARELFGPHATYENGNGNGSWIGAMRPVGPCEQIGHGATLEDALANARSKIEAGDLIVTQLEFEKGGVTFSGVDVVWPKGKPAIPKFDAPEAETDKKDGWHIRRWAAKQINTTCLTANEGFRVLDRFMATREELDESAIMEEAEELSPAEAFAREHEDDDGEQEEPGEEATPENEAPVIYDEDMETVGASDLDDAERELVAA
jgi:hypothetical protein